MGEVREKACHHWRTCTCAGVLGLLVAAAAPAEEARLYWAQRDGLSGKIMRAGLDGTGAEALVVFDGSPYGIALDASRSWLFWTDGAGGRVFRSGLNGENPATIVLLGASMPGLIAADSDGGKLYWTNRTLGLIQRANMDGSGLETVVSGLGEPVGISLHLDEGWMYWTDSDEHGVYRARFDGSSMEEVLIGGLNSPTGIAVESISQKLYVTSVGSLKRANLDGSDGEYLVQGFGFVLGPGLALDVWGGRAYYSSSQNEVLSIWLNGGGQQTIVEDVDARGVAVWRPGGIDPVNIPAMSAAGGGVLVALLLVCGAVLVQERERGKENQGAICFSGHRGVWFRLGNGDQGTGNRKKRGPLGRGDRSAIPRGTEGTGDI